MDRKTVIIVSESWLLSFIRDLGTLVMFAVMIGLGVYLESGAMQWIGGVLFLIWLAAKVPNFPPLTVPQARKKLDQIEANQETPNV